MPFQYTPPPHKKNDILYEDKDLLLVNKPCGLLSVPGRGDDKQDCLISRIIADYKDALIVHRLDMDTSGLIVLARNKDCQRMLSYLFQQRKINKVYTAIVDGIIKEERGEINLPLITDWPNRPKQIVDQQHGKASITHYNVIQRNVVQNCCRVKLTPLTGRTHQLRVHMQALKHVILGDNLYANEAALKKSSRLLLHADLLEFTHPVSNKLISCHSHSPF
jgi:tRNA pseudouridine32 synthase/23S rRNA pseudouridine746 synthase